MLESASEDERWDPIPGLTGSQAEESASEDEDAGGRSQSEQPFEDGVSEAVHDQMLQAAVAAKVGQGMAILFGIFVCLGAQAEAGLVEMQSALAGLRVRDAMMTRFRTLAAHDRLAKAVQELLAGSQQDFPVLDNDQPVGILRRNDLVMALSKGRREAARTRAAAKG